MEQFYEPVAKDFDSVFLIMDGSAYYDVELGEEDWIRINVERGDLIIIPRGRSFRFTLTTQVLIVSFIHSFSLLLLTLKRQKKRNELKFII